MPQDQYNPNNSNNNYNPGTDSQNIPHSQPEQNVQNPFPPSQQQPVYQPTVQNIYSSPNQYPQQSVQAQNPQFQQANQNQEYSSNPYPQYTLKQGDDIFSKYSSLVRKYPGKTAYAASLIAALFFTVLPWTGTLFTNSSYNYFYFLGRNFFAGLYVIGILTLLFIRYSIWFNLKSTRPYLKILDYVETVLVGAITMFTFTIGSFGDIQIGLILSVACTVTALTYITYIKLLKNK